MKKIGIFFAIMLGIAQFTGVFSCTYAATTPQGRAILNKLKDEGRTDNELKNAIKDLGYSTEDYFPNTNIDSSYEGDYENTYTSRSCKIYSIEYIDEIDAYTSPDLLKKEYFISLNYLKRYIDSRNPQKSGCPANKWKAIEFYNDNSQDTERYVAPNGKIYFLYQKDGLYYSTNLSSSIGFSTLFELKNYIRDHNSLSIRNI